MMIFAFFLEFCDYFYYLQLLVYIFDLSCPCSSKTQLGNHIFLSFSKENFDNSINIHTRMFKVIGKSFQSWDSSLGRVTISDGKYLPLLQVHRHSKDLYLISMKDMEASMKLLKKLKKYMTDTPMIPSLTLLEKIITKKRELSI